MRRALRTAARAAQAAQWVPLGYLGAVTLFGVLPRRPSPPGRDDVRFVVLVPAHDEQDHVARTVAALAATDYPPERRRIVVIADNCTDATAARAAEAGAEVWERHDPAERGKGAALDWAMVRLLADEGWDAVVLVDADSVVDPGFLRALAGRLRAGARAVQGSYRVANPSASVVARLAEASFAAQSVLRPRGRARLGAAAKLQGNGMAFERSVVAAHRWSARGITEDIEHWLVLLRDGIHPVHEPEAEVVADMPTTVAAARVQRDRWESGRVQLARTHARDDLRLALRRRDPVLAEAVLSELVFPPLATQAALVVATGALRRLTGDRRWGTTAAQTGVLVAHAAAGLAVARAPARTWLAVLLAPAVIAWKLARKARGLLRRGPLAWERTPRS